MNAYIGVPGFLTFFAMLVLTQFLWRLVAIRFADAPLGKAMAFIN